MQHQSNMSLRITSPSKLVENGTSQADLSNVIDSKLTGMPSLPIELRLKIWGYTLPGERIVDANVIAGIIHVNSPPPIAFAICKESRLEALMHHSVRLDNKFAAGPHAIDPKMDILHLSDYRIHHDGYGPFNRDHPISAFVGEENFLADGIRGQIQRLAMDMDVWCAAAAVAGWEVGSASHVQLEGLRYDEMLDSLAEFTSLKELIIVLHFSSCREGWRRNRTDAKVSFVDERQNILLYRSKEELKEETVRVMRDVRERHPGWSPKLHFVSMNHGGRGCCLEEEQEL